MTNDERIANEILTKLEDMLTSSLWAENEATQRLAIFVENTIKSLKEELLRD